MEYCGQFNLKEHSTLKIGPCEAHVAYIDSKDDILKALVFAKEHSLIPYPLGGGSNTAFKDTAAAIYLFLIPRMKEMRKIKEEENKVLLEIEAGLTWDDAVTKAVSLGFSGIEALSGIPGLTGSAPVQNIGAYGAEVKDTIETVRAYDMQQGVFIDFQNKECEFEYRNSIFKKNPGRYFIYSVIFSLSKKSPLMPEYKDVISYFEAKNISLPTLREISEAIIEIRNKKLPNPKETPNAGSYFKNPIIEEKKANELKVRFPDLPSYPAQNGNVKLFAGWLIDKAGLKGFKQENFGIHQNHALVLIGNGKGTLSELLSCEETIKTKVDEMFGVILEREPVIVS